MQHNMMRSHFSRHCAVLPDNRENAFLVLPVKGFCSGGYLLVRPPPAQESEILETQLILNSALRVVKKDPGIVQTRDQELLIALFKSFKFQLTRKLELVYIF